MQCEGLGVDLAGQERMEDGYGQESSSRRRHLHVSVKSQESQLSTNVDSGRVYLICTDQTGSNRIRSEIRDFLSDLHTEEESSSVVAHASVTREPSLTRCAYLGAYIVNQSINQS